MKKTALLLTAALLMLLILLSGCKPQPPDTILKTLVLPTRTPLPTATFDPRSTLSPFQETAIAATSAAATASALAPTRTATEPPTETPAPQSMPMTREVTFAFDAGHGLLIAFGGMMPNGVDVSDQTWAWDGAHWLQLHPAHSPSPRSNAAMIYDSTNQQMMLFGGGRTDGQQFNDTWTWDGKDWTEQHPAASPSPRVDARLAYDPISDRVVLFSGAFYPPDGGEAIFYHETWTWDGKNWAKRNSGSISNGQIPQPGLAFDSALERSVLWQFGSGLWVLENQGWKNVTPTSPSPDIFLEGVLGYDEIRQQLVLWGQNTLVSPEQSETWTWDSSTWTKVEAAGGPDPAAVEPHLFFDPQHRRLLLLVCNANKVTGGSYEIWAWNGASWQKVGP